MEIRIEKVDPERAKALLAGTRNRRLRNYYVAKLARDMEAGNWRPNSVIQIATTPDGEVLIDGQHRMAAVISSNVPQEFIVACGLSLNDQLVIDTGRSRTLSDTLTLRGETNTQTLAAAIGWLWRRQRGVPASQSMPTMAEGLQVLHDNPALRQSLAPTRPACSSLRISGGLGCCLHYEMSKLDPESADDFWHKLHTGLDVHERHPIYLLRSRLEKNAISTVARIDTVMIHALIIKAWNVYLHGGELGSLRWGRGGANPEPFPAMEGPD